ncbi:hypothetical protein PGT21_008369 [Puccinia graminis f. sp. tritici]|uniref:RING-type E3 ubiquitin transferase n=1 Tax=Puccinia graminis f. sp. tritici TaxID=56615 RepID=A0A5B0MHP7_PUCGR|nr:hypothetical protein PGT21_008369 [Puccinia graminis f. sp. tritici]
MLNNLASIRVRIHQESQISMLRLPITGTGLGMEYRQRISRLASQFQVAIQEIEMGRLPISADFSRITSSDITIKLWPTKRYSFQSQTDVGNKSSLFKLKDNNPESQEFSNHVQEEAADANTHATELDQCSICLAQTLNPEELHVVSSCGHLFHKVCIQNWLQLKVDQTCPVCRFPIQDPELLPLAIPRNHIQLVSQVVRKNITSLIQWLISANPPGNHPPLKLFLLLVFLYWTKTLIFSSESSIEILLFSFLITLIFSLN